MSLSDLTLVMPAKNAARYVERSLSSVAAQHGSDSLELLVVYAQSDDNTLESITNFCKANNITCRIWHQIYDMNRDLADAILTITRPYFAFLCFSDEYLDTRYLLDSVDVLRTDDSLSYVHSNLYTKSGTSLFLSLPVRSLVLPTSKSSFYANATLLGDGINELTYVGVTQTAQHLISQFRGIDFFVRNTFLSLFYYLFLYGYTGHYLPRFSTIGYHHPDSRNNQPQLTGPDEAVIRSYKRKMILIPNLISQGRMRWMSSRNTPLSARLQKAYNLSYFDQIEHIKNLSDMGLFNPRSK